MNIVVFDLEIRKNIVTGALDKPLDEETEVSGWGNFHKAGISVACLFDYQTSTYRLFGEHSLGVLVQRLNDADFIVGYNHVNFDYKVIDFLTDKRINRPERDIDILQEIWKVIGRQKGTSLENIAQSTLQTGKYGDGALAPIMWQEGAKDRNKIVDLCDYCMGDVAVTKKLFDFICSNDYVLKGSQKIELKNIGNKLRKGRTK